VKNLKQGLTRRGFLKTTGVVAGSAVAGNSLGLVGEAAALETRGMQTLSTGEETFVNTCRGNCGGKCALVGKVRNGKLVQTRPYDVPEGLERCRMGCVKGQTNPQRLYAANRILYPMRQAGERGSGNWERISWDEAISEIAEKFQATIDEYGPHSLGIWHSYGSDGWLNGAYYQTYGVGYNRLVNHLGATAVIPGGDQAQVYMGFYVLQHGMNTTSDYANAKTLLMWGANISESVRDAWPYVCDARDKGASIVTIDPRFTITAAASDTFLPIRAGTDGALMLAMCNYIIDNNLIDNDFLANKSVAPLLLKENGSYFKLSDMGVEPIVGPINPYTGMPTIIDPEVVYDTSTQTFGSSKQVKNPAILGTYEYEGIKLRTVFDYVKEQTKQFTVEMASKECDLTVEQIETLAHLYATNKPATVVTAQGICHHVNSRHNYKNLVYLASLTGNMNCPGGSVYLSKSHAGVAKTKLTMTDMIPATAKPVSKVCSMRLPEVLDTGKLAGKDYPIKCLYITNANPFASESGRQAFLNATKKVDFIVTADSFMSDTARYSDVVLPICLAYEEMDKMAAGSLEIDFVMQKAVEPAGECKSDMDVYRMLADKMGFSELYDKTDEEYLHTLLDNKENKATGRTYDDFVREGIIADFGDTPQIGAEFNATGRVQFYLPMIIPRDVGVTKIAPTELIPWYEHAEEAYQANPLRDKYPLFGNSEHSNYTGHSMYNNIPWIREIWGEPYAMINKKAAADRGIEQGDTVRVYNDRGHVVLKAVLTEGLRYDSIVLPHGPQEKDYVSGHHQDLTLACSDLTGNSSFYDYLCEVEKYEGGEH
ncbi:MAG: molybdopterin-dependent oxidoreductase, partial [Gordonibacter sp.]|uniref:molybdopterin-dependent oxidoreductase n=1 Tax=Gordonibacter sp. TaxID=1968902 RepID=UPI002FCAEB3A